MHLKLLKDIIGKHAVTKVFVLCVMETYGIQLVISKFVYELIFHNYLFYTPAQKYCSQKWPIHKVLYLLVSTIFLSFDLSFSCFFSNLQEISIMSSDVRGHVIVISREAE